MFTAAKKKKLMLKSQGSRAQLKLTLISIMVVKKTKQKKTLHFCERLTEIASVWLVMCEVMLI